ncbi:MAG: hypothetical protein OIF47_06365 [Marinibacterium sp.]|nr:hypothetical protein [Marinibacterium sp.]
MMKAVALVLAALAFVAGPFLVPGFDGFSAGQFPVPQIAPPIQPAGYAFLIWGVIYVWLLASALFGLLWRRDAPDWGPMRAPLILSLVIGAAWLSVAERNPLAATVMIWLMLGSGLVAMARAPHWDRWYARAPIALYCGWLTAASVVAVGLVLAGYGLVDQMVAAWAMLGLGLVIGVTVLLSLPDCPDYGAALAWALVAIALANLGVRDGFAGAATAGALIIALLTLRSGWQALK